MTDKPTNIHEALSRAKLEIGVIGKDDENEQQHYAFRGIDSIVNKVGPVFAELGIVVAPVHRLISSDDVLSRNNAKGYRVVVETEWTFSINPKDEESYLTAQTLGESIDYSDKAINQAQTQSFKNALAQVLTIPTGESDPDSTTPEQVVPKTVGERILEALTLEGFELVTAKKYTLEAMKLLELKNPIPEERIADVVTHAIELRNEAEAPMAESGDGDDPSEGYQ
jgi:hypothetical protein